MRTTVSFFGLLQEALRISFKHRFLWWFVVPLGIIAFILSELSKNIEQHFDTEPEHWPEFVGMFSQSFSALLLPLGLLILFGLLRSSLRGPLFLYIEHALTAPTVNRSILLDKKLVFRGALRSIGFEAGYWLILLIVLTLMSFPTFMALRFNPEVASPLGQIGLLLGITLTILFFFLKEFGLLYSLLAHMRFPLALELALRLFKKHIFFSLLFGFFLLLLSILFTFPTNLAMIASGSIPIIGLRHSIAIAVLIILLGYGALLEEILRLLFFHVLAATPKTPLPKIKELIEEKKPGNAPTA